MKENITVVFHGFLIRRIWKRRFANALGTNRLVSDLKTSFPRPTETNCQFIA